MMAKRIQITVDIQLSEKHRTDLDMLGIDYSTPFEAKIQEALSQMIDVLAKVLEPEDLPRITIKPVVSNYIEMPLENIEEAEG